MTVQYFPFGAYHGKPQVQGSTYLRMVQMEKYWPEFSQYKYGANPDALIFQKVYMQPDYSFPAHFENVKILDMCDPDWLDDTAVVETCQAMDAVTCSSESLAEFVRQFHNNVHVIPDRFDLENVPKPKKHTGDAQTVVWFGYSHNAELLKPAMNLLDELNLNLILISNDDPFPHKWSSREHESFYSFVKYSEDTFYQDIQKADFAILPQGFRPIDKFKSNNKTIKANLAGLPVAIDADQVRKYMDAKERQAFIDTSYVTIQSEYDVRKSIEQYQDIIKRVGRIG